MEIFTAKANVVVLRGVFHSDVEQYKVSNNHMFGPTLTQRFGPDAAVIEAEDIFAYSAIPVRFETVEAWPTQSNLKCWECDLIPPGYPAFLPVNPEKKEGRYECDVLGNFCCWNCVARYAERELSKEKLWDTLKCICIFEALFTGARCRERIMAAPPKTMMKAYCGSRGLSMVEWRARIATLNANYMLTNFRLTQVND
jgi:hypothetical protein